VPHEQWVEMTGSLSHKKSGLPSPHQLHGHLILFDFEAADYQVIFPSV
jgi:hypothetical protein